MKTSKPVLERVREMSLYEAFRSSNDVMFYCDCSADIIEVNPAFLKLYGYRREEVIGRNPRILRSDHTPAELYKRMWEAVQDPVRGFWRGPIVNKAKDGREIPLLLSITAIRDADDRALSRGSVTEPYGEEMPLPKSVGKRPASEVRSDAAGVIGYMAVGMDMTEQLSLKTRVAQSEALANIGEMAAVVAHEIRNPLGSVVIAANQLATDSVAPEDKGMVMKLLRSESKRLTDVLAGFLAYARPPSLRLARADLNALVTEVLGIAQSNKELMRHTRVSVSLDPSLKSCAMDSDQVRQVVWNIMVNALQAMDGYGKLTVTTGREPGWVFFRVRDTGPGISEAVLREILKPFFTTKQQGTGLGLATADRIVKAHGGVIGVESRPGDGAVFTVRLPETEA